MTRARTLWLLPGLWTGASCAEEAAPPAPPPAVVQDAPPEFAGRSRALLDQELETPVPGDPVRAAEFLKEAQQFWNVKRPKEARTSLEQALAADPASVPAHLLLGELLLEPGGEKDASIALQHFRLARLLEPDQLFAVLGEARARCDLEDDERSRALFGEVLQRVAQENVRLPPSVYNNVHRSLGILAFRAENSDKALEELDRAIALDPRDRRALYWRALVLERMERWAEADAQLREAIELKPDDGRLHFARSRILRRLGQGEEAARESRIHEILARFEDDESTRFAEDSETRIQLRRELIEVYPEFSRAPHLLVRELLDAGQPREALEVLQQLQAEHPEDAETLFLEALAEALDGRKEDARNTARSLLDSGAVPAPVYEDLLRRIEETRID